MTLRDGGHQVEFDWPVNFAAQYSSAALQLPDMDFVEIGYWKQTAKFDGRFYSVDEALVRSMNIDPGRLAVMIDYHYCHRDLGQYPSQNETSFGLIRLTSRRESVKNAVDFLADLKEKTASRTSINIFNISNYTHGEILNTLDAIKNRPPDFVYLADTHGAIDLTQDGERFAEYADKVSSFGSTPGFHLHNHLGYALSNYKALHQLGFGVADASLNGLGKGTGNLQLEQIVSVDATLPLLDLWAKNLELFKMDRKPHGLIAARLSAADHYADQAEDMRVPSAEFFAFLKTLVGAQRDNFDQSLMREYFDEGSN